VKILNRAFGALILHELTAHRIEHYKRERLTGRWRGHGATSAPKPIKPATVNRELDTLKSMLAKAVEWQKLLDSPARGVKRLKVDNRRTRILTEEEQVRLIEGCPGKLRPVVTLALTTGARAGELLKVRWDDIEDGMITLLETKNGRARRIPVSPAIRAVLEAKPRIYPWVFTNKRAKTPKPYTVNGVAHVFNRAVQRAGITTGDVTLHTLRHTALSRMIAEGHDDYTVMEISGHSSTRMLGRYTHPTEARKVSALDLPAVVNIRPTYDEAAEGDPSTASEVAELLRKIGGRQEARTPDLRVANAALSQLS